MLSNLILEKSSSDLNNFLLPIYVLSKHNGTLTRDDFVCEMANLLQINAKNGDKENRTAYNKVKLAHFFGFTSLDKIGSISYISLTPRGWLLSQLIRIDGTPVKDKICIDPDRTYIVRQLFMESIVWGTFGRYNAGVETSNSDTDPVSIIFRVLYELEHASLNELCYAIYTMNGGKDGSENPKSIQEALEDIQQHRLNSYDYKQYFVKRDLQHICSQVTCLVLLAKSSIDVLRFSKSEGYSLSPEIDKQFLTALRRKEPYYNPLNLLVYSNNKYDDVRGWLLKTLINQDENSSSIFEVVEGETQDAFQRKLLCAIKKANSYINKKIYFLSTAETKESLWQLYGPYISILNRVADFKSDKNGCSVSSVTIDDLTCSLPANIQLITIIKNEE